MKQFLLALAFNAIFFSAFSQGLTTLPNGGNKRASVSERLGLVDVTIQYNRPGVKGREGKIWGDLIPAGFTDQGFGSSKAAPWRAGANENTTIEFTSDVTVEGKPLKAGKYALFVAYDSLQPTLIFSKNNSSWGSFFYDDKEDELRVKVTPVRASNSVEWLKYEFMNETESGATVALQWERLMIPFKVETAYVQDQVASFQKELRTDKSFNWTAWNAAAQWCLQHNVNLEQALRWSDSAMHPFFGGTNLFAPKSTKAQILQKLGRSDEASALMKQALPVASMQELHAYGRSLLAQKKAKEALEVFQLNHQKNPAEFTAMVGLARGYSANGDYKNALKYAQQALALAPDAQNKASLQGMVEKLKKAQDVN